MSDQMREKFEEWAKSLQMSDLNRHLDGYENQVINSYWAVWQAAIESVVVEFTEEVYFCPSKTELEQASDKGFIHAMEMVKGALDKSGIKYE